jgi:hypothetical protein
MASAVKTNRSHIIANEATMTHTRKRVYEIDRVLEEITGCLDATSAGLQSRMEVIEEITTDNIAEMTTRVN